MLVRLKEPPEPRVCPPSASRLRRAGFQDEGSRFGVTRLTRGDARYGGCGAGPALAHGAALPVALAQRAGRRHGRPRLPRFSRPGAPAAPARRQDARRPRAQAGRRGHHLPGPV